MFVDSIVFKQQNYWPVLQVVWVGGGQEKGHFYCERHKWMTLHDVINGLEKNEI